MAYKRSKVVRDAESFAAARCPEPCGKMRYLSRASARREGRRMAGVIPGRSQSSQQVYRGQDGTCCEGFFHMRTRRDSGQTSFYRSAEAFARQHGLPPGWQVSAHRDGQRWRYSIYVPGEEPMPSLYTYGSQEIALDEAAADVLGESRSA